MINWISERLGTAPAESFDPEGFVVLDVRHLVDKAGNETGPVRDIIGRGVEALARGERVVVCCDYGISRSNAIAIGILSRASGIPFDEAVRQVSERNGAPEIKIEPLNIVRSALGLTSAGDRSQNRIIVTGGNGFIGRALTRSVGHKYQMVAPTRQQCDLTEAAFNLDLIVKSERIGRIVHLANPRVYSSTRAIGEAITMLRNVLDVCRENGTDLLYLSSWEVYAGHRDEPVYADELTPLKPFGAYGEGKMLCEFLVEHYRQYHGVKCAMLRPPPVYGSGSDRPKFLYNFIAKCAVNATVTSHMYRNGPPRTELLNISDLVAAIDKVLATGFIGDLNLGAGIVTGTDEIAAEICQLMGSSSRLETVPIAAAAPCIRMNNSLARQRIGWEPRIKLSEGLASIISDWKSKIA